MQSQRNAVTLTREQRDTLHYELAVAKLDQAFDGAWIIRRLEKHRQLVEDLIPLLDQIGWGEKGDRESYTVTVDRERFGHLLEQLRARAAEEMRRGGDVSSPKLAERVDGAELEQMRADWREYIDEELGLWSVCNDVLRQLEASR